MTTNSAIWTSLAQRRKSCEIASWFAMLARTLLNESWFFIAAEPHRLIEIEFYYHSKDHSDPFAHRDPVQVHNGRWYFHRTGGSYRSGSFKGLDLSFGDESVFGGILFRSVETHTGDWIVGPSLLVDYVLDLCKVKTVAELDQRIAGRPAWEKDNPLHLKPSPMRDHAVYQTARVGLSLKKKDTTGDKPRFVLKPYRFLTEPKRIAKGKPELALSMFAQGLALDSICRISGGSKASVQRYIDAFEAGRRARSFDRYIGKHLNTEERCQLHGTWCEHYANN